MNLVINTDGGARGNPGPAGIGVVVYDTNHALLYSCSKYISHQTNNIAEYIALLHALRWLDSYRLEKKIKSAIFYLDSQLVVNQVKGLWKVKKDHLKKLQSEAVQIIERFDFRCDFLAVPREENAEADALVNKAIDGGLS